MKNTIKKILFPLIKLNRFIKHQYYTYLGKHNIHKLVSIRYMEHFGKKLNIHSPTTLNEKILWLKMYSDTSSWTFLADKYKVREYIISKGLESILVKLYGKWDNANDIDWNTLPQKFVLKVNNGSGDVLVCNNKSELDLKKVTKKYSKLLEKPFGYATGEPHYALINPCIIAEELLDVKKQSIKTSSLIDYKIWCFNGEPECIWVCYNRTSESVEVGTYDLNWNYHPEYSIYTNHYIKASEILPKPHSLKEMINIAKILSNGLPQVRVDLYEVGNKPYFGELTFSSNYGMMDFYTDEYQLYLGSKININNA